MKVTVLYNGRPISTFRGVLLVRHEKEGVRVMERGFLWSKTLAFYPVPAGGNRFGVHSFRCEL